jgi:hypothetical protein
MLYCLCCGFCSISLWPFQNACCSGDPFFIALHCYKRPRHNCSPTSTNRHVCSLVCVSHYRVSAGSTLHITVYDKLNLAESFLSKVRQKGHAEPSGHQADVLVQRRWVLVQLQSVSDIIGRA